MKTTIKLLFIYVLFISCNQVAVPKKLTNSVKPKLKVQSVFKVQIRNDVYNDYGYVHYTIYFTNDDFKTENHLNQVFDLSSIMNEEWVRYQEIALDKLEAIQLSKRLCTYDDCIKFNDSVYRLYKYKKAYAKSLKYSAVKKGWQKSVKPEVINVKCDE